MRGLIEVVDAPQIDGTRTLGVHRVLQTMVQGKPRSGELYNYSAHFGDYQVIVTANPVVVPGPACHAHRHQSGPRLARQIGRRDQELISSERLWAGTGY